ncbi:MAG TPA: recombinase family protein [Terriglobia bacterium]
MPKQEHLREIVMGELDPERLRQRTAEGWKLVAVEWQREVEGAGEAEDRSAEEVPFGMMVAEDCFHLVENPKEREALVLMMDLIVQDHPLSHVARELNLKGFRTRKGNLWSQVSVFNMLPRLVDVGPRIFSSEDWEARRKRLLTIRRVS